MQANENGAVNSGVMVDVARCLVVLAAWCLVAAATSGASPKPSFYFILGIEGTGHHFWDGVGIRLHAQELRGVDDMVAKRMEKVIHEVTACFFTLSVPKTPTPCPFCFPDQVCGFRWGAGGWPTARALAINGCSYPCGARNKKGGLDHFKYTSPDFPRVVRELHAWSDGYVAKPVVMLRDPVAAAHSAHFRRHAMEQDFETTAFELYQSMGLLDRQVRTVEGDGVPALVVHYEDIVDRATEAGYANATQRVAAFLGYEAPALRLALAGDHGRPKPKVNANNFKPPQRHYVEYLFLLSATAADWFPRLWPDCARYVDGARRRQRADLARRRR